MRRLALACLLAGLGLGTTLAAAPTPALRLASPAFKPGGMIPAPYTCDGRGISPPLAWTGVPKGARSLALAVEDPDAPGRTFVHWVLFNLPPGLRSLPAGVPPAKVLPNGARHGRNDFGRLGYGPPSPPAGTHRYYFRLLALSTRLALPSGISEGQLLKAAGPSILARAELMGRYRRAGQ
jgi:hypothetical protein